MHSSSTAEQPQAVIRAQVIGMPTLLWLAFLAWRVGPSLRKLQRSHSHIMTTYYAFLWAVGLLNVLRCAAYIGQVESSRPLLLNLLWLLTRFGAGAPPSLPAIALQPRPCKASYARGLHWACQVDAAVLQHAKRACWAAPLQMTCASYGRCIIRS